MKRSLLAVLCLALSAVCITTSQLAAAPHYGDPWKFKQPDGSLVDVRVFGDEYYQVVETPDGYTLMRDPSTQWIVYATLSSDGNELRPTNVRYGGGSPALAGVSPHIRINPDAARLERNASLLQAFPETPAMYAGGAPKAVPPKTGNVVGLVLLADFSDINGTISVTEVTNYCNQVGYSNNSNNGSVHDYFDDVSNGSLNYTLDVSADYWEGTGGSFVAYYDDCSKPWLSRAIELIKEILTDMDANGTDFSNYDANGDGEIDAINLYFAGGGTVCGWAKGMWPGSGGMGGSWSADGVSANRFQITHMGNTLTLGTFCHENGHMVCGWPDLYDYDGDSEGVGKFDLMCDYASNTNPCEPSSELKISAGWMTATALPATPTTDIDLPLASTNFAYSYAKSATEYYLIENRQKTGRDAAIPDAGLALWHIDTAKWIPGNGNDEQDMTPAKHYYVTLVQADGDWDMENAVNRGDTGDLYASPNDTEATPCTDPDTDWWDGTESGLSITNISANASTMTFDFSDEDNAPVARVIHDYSDTADEDCCISVGVSDIDSLSYDPDGPGDISTLCITHVDGVLIGCEQTVEVCGDGVHTLRLTIVDLCGNTSYADAPVEVIDDTPPTIVIELDRDVLWPPNHKMVTVCADVTAEDNCDDSLTVALVSVTSDEPDNDKGDGNTTNDIQNAATGTNDACFDLRSERQGGEDGRCYTIIYSATDDAGNASLDTVCVTVPHDQGASAFSSLGFNPTGTDLKAVNSFAVLVRGDESLDVRKIDHDRIFAGNTAGVVTPTRLRELDVDADGRLDLAVMFDNLGQEALALLTMANVDDGTGAITKGTVSDGPIGIHLVAGGVSYLISNIYGLGAPVELPTTQEKDIRDPNALSQAPIGASEAKFVTRINSVHPNPFNPQTNVSFTLASSARVQIAIYDVTGAVVRRLVDETMQAGDHQARWNGMNDSGQVATSGIYFLRMIAGSYTEVRKIVMLK